MNRLFTLLFAFCLFNQSFADVAKPDTLYAPLTYNNFKLLFKDDIACGYRYKYDQAIEVADRQPLPKTVNLYNWSEAAGKTIYALTKLENSNGVDMFIIYIVDNEKPDSLVHNKKYLLIFKNGQLLNKKELTEDYQGKSNRGQLNYYFDYECKLNTIQYEDIPEGKLANTIPLVVTHTTQYVIDSVSGTLQVAGKMYDTLSNSANYKQFKSVFVDLFTDKKPEVNHKRITDNVFAGELFEFKNQSVYTIGKIENYRGYDLFLLSADDYDNYWAADNYVASVDYLLVFKNNLPDNAYVAPMYVNAISIDGVSEGGNYMLSSYFDKDTTLVSTLTKDICCSATGFQTSISYYEKYRSQIDTTGSLVQIDVIEPLYFVSPFFFPKQLDSIATLYKNFDDYPHSDDPYCLYSLDDDNGAGLPPMNLFFYVCESEKGGYCTQLYTGTKEGKIIDVLTVCNKGDNPKVKIKKQVKPVNLQQYKNTDELLLLNTASGTYKLLPNGVLKRITN